MRAKKNDTKFAKKGKETQTACRRSSRLRSLTLPNDRGTKSNIQKATVTKVKAQIGFQHESGSAIKTRRGTTDPHLSKVTKQSECDSTERTSKQLATGTLRKETTSEQVLGRKVQRTMKQKPKRLKVEHSNKVRDAVHKDSNDSVSDASQNENERGKLQLIKEITIKENHYGKPSITRYSDVAFLVDNHVLALDDNFLRRKHGQRICCISLDGKLVCDLLVPGYPMSVVVLSPMEAVVSMRGLGSNGLLWISIDIHNRSMEITRNVPFKTETFGLSYSAKLETFVVSYNKKPYMSVLNREGKEVRKMSCKPGPHYRCLILEDNTILSLDHHSSTVCIMDQRGEVINHLKHDNLKDPLALECDCFSNIYVGCFRSGHLLKFDSEGRYLRSFECIPSLCAIGLDRMSDRIAIASKNSIFVYMLDKCADNL
ncbi:hypothetical protein FSP39_022114 [Pinctada imbricata]|uniref:Uncharacterized protein n=1 Tax=Pinctada imbricata TaxID=66713 RepID=A0AA88XU83_PINIB|nr:hypothetical protein FSP39_022114 [Pinctada imbricata]